MKNEEMTKEQIEDFKNRIENIISILTEHCDEIGEAFVNNIFKSFLSEIQPDKCEVDSLFLLWGIIKEAKEIKKLNMDVNQIQTLIN